MRLRTGMLLMVFVTAACGKKGALIYPEMIAPAAPAGVNAQQTGAEVRISLQLPDKDLAGRPLNTLAGVDLYKQWIAAGAGGTCTACSPESPPYRTVFLDHLETTVQKYDSHLVMLDSQVKPDTDYTYFIKPFLQDGTAGTMSLPAIVSVVPVLSPPQLKAVSEPAEVRLEFSFPPEDGSLVGFAVYRTIKGQPFPYLPYTKQPVTSFMDFGLQRQVVYTYIARAVVRMPNGALVESAASNVVEAQLLEE